MKEAELHLKLNHPNIIKLINILDDAKKDKLYFLCELANRGQVLKWIPEKAIFQASTLIEGQQYKEEEIIDIIRDAAEGLKYLHSNKIAHRDIKPLNLLFVEKTVKITDFSVAESFDSSDIVEKTVGTIHFWPPECCSGVDTKFSAKAIDIWSLGVTLYCLMNLKLPFYHQSMVEILEMINKNAVDPPKHNYSKELQMFCEYLMEKDAIKRPKIEEVLKHPIFVKKNL